MSVFVACPHCGVKLNVPETLLGKKVRCAKCSMVFESKKEEPVPSPMPPPLPAPPPPPAAAMSPPEPEPALPEASLDEDAGYDLREDRGERRRSHWAEDDDDYDEREERSERRRRRRRMRRDLVPHRGGVVLTLGILSIVASMLCSVFCSLVGPLVGAGLGLPAVLLGHADLRQIHGGSMDPDGEGQTRIGMILGYVGLGLSFVVFLMCGAYLVFVISTSQMRHR
jgi:hypothetical protein